MTRGGERTRSHTVSPSEARHRGEIKRSEGPSPSEEASLELEALPLTSSVAGEELGFLIRNACKKNPTQ